MAVYAHINTVPNGSTGGIMMKEHNGLLAKGEDSYAFGDEAVRLRMIMS